ncbi:hypothetical protein F5Y16DRAFT_271476 [Xylariaceae sp. FL0255]|nr:hypothetical protein F5Y16DRAFT_271476 [Xylariaceae sp. FL0255]
MRSQGAPRIALRRWLRTEVAIPMIITCASCSAVGISEFQSSFDQICDSVEGTNGTITGTSTIGTTITMPVLATTTPARQGTTTTPKPNAASTSPAVVGNSGNPDQNQSSNPTPTHSPGPSPSPHTSLSTGAIAGIAVGIVLIVVVGAVLVWFLLRRERQAKGRTGGSQSGGVDYVPEQIVYGSSELPDSGVARRGLSPGGGGGGGGGGRLSDEKNPVTFDVAKVAGGGQHPFTPARHELENQPPRSEISSTPVSELPYFSGDERYMVCGDKQYQYLLLRSPRWRNIRNTHMHTTGWRLYQHRCLPEVPRLPRWRLLMVLRRL